MVLFLFFAIFGMAGLAINHFLGADVPKKDVTRTLHIMATARGEELPMATLSPASKGTKTFVTRIDAVLQRFGFAQKLERLILHAGSKTSVGAVVGTSAAATMGGILLAHVTVGLLPIDVLVGIAAGLARWMLLKLQRGKRVRKFDMELVNAIELLTRALRAGHSVNSAIEIVAEQSAEPLRSEFAAVSRQQRFGVIFRDSMLELADRMPSKDLHFLITAILVQKETGGDLTEILERTARTIRERMRIHGEIKTKTAQGRFTGTILALLPVVMLLSINLITPSYTHVLFHDSTGQKLLYVGAGMIAVGAAVIRKIVDIKV